jgi:alginate O-acetyltransferase complex protein AlgI
MTFTTLPFIIFIAIFFTLWPLLRRYRSPRYWVILIASCIFYGWWDWRFLALLGCTALVDYWAALLMGSKPAYKKVWLGVSIGLNLSVLGFFKYFNFFFGQVSKVASSLGADWSYHLNVILPIGLSFYTFQSMSYAIDVYRGHLQPCRNPLQYFAFLSLFPQLVAGPIVRARDFIPQLETAGDYNAENRWLGLRHIALGFFKKMVIADNLAPIVDKLFAAGGIESGAIYWLGASALFGIQIYCDFSGYSSIAIGLAQWMGYRFPQNFNQPYISRGVTEFWTRWHMSLSTWFRDYVYIPLGGGRQGFARSLRNLWITMLTSGLWHGANWTFLIWGGLHASYSSIERISKEKLGFSPSVSWKLPGKVFAYMITMLAVTYAWLWFRAPNLEVGLMATRSILVGPLSGGIVALLAFFGVKTYAAITAYVTLELGQVLTSHSKRANSIFEWLAPLLVAAAFALSLLLRGDGHTFIYFQF